MSFFPLVTSFEQGRQLLMLFPCYLTYLLYIWGLSLWEQCILDELQLILDYLFYLFFFTVLLLGNLLVLFGLGYHSKVLKDYF